MAYTLDQMLDRIRAAQTTADTFAVDCEENLENYKIFGLRAIWRALFYILGALVKIIDK